MKDLMTEAIQRTNPPPSPTKKFPPLPTIHFNAKKSPYLRIITDNEGKEYFHIFLARTDEWAVTEVLGECARTPTFVKFIVYKLVYKLSNDIKMVHTLRRVREWRKQEKLS